ncbi:dTDP-4-dehydrorhamnose 3,5-epimerase family protein [Nocardioides lijunqiniae]|uniref:dTDP-4-dehydrorhamnose 3,5-epimerase family protein n=1 Tax=Nocardioides lijunqiniae TaxID=2760832 RepID=UPI001878E4C3|nr:dTDP-4-dehydrorhamnose 3,5-epimerase [Nocardioides lijunqiniae]
MLIGASRIPGVCMVTPEIFRDDRGHFLSTFSADADVMPPEIAFPVAQVSQSRSRAGVARGIHFTTTAPGCAKLVWCSAGSALDFVVDLRVGSPTFGQVEMVELDPEVGRIVSMPVGVGHAYLATADDTVITYLLSTVYVATNEQSVAISDPDVGLPLPPAQDLVLSERDGAAHSLAWWQDSGGLPEYAESVRLDALLRSAG